MAEPFRKPQWVGDNVVERVAGYMRTRPGTPLCETCIAKALTLPLTDVRVAIGRLVTARRCEDGLWWCADCGTKVSVTVAFSP